MAATGNSLENGIRLSALSPKYLHTNSTSHTWPFSAIAELIDNAYDPDVDASQLWIDVKKYRGQLCLTFTDNGAGMDASKLHKMLSFGFCEKVEKKGHMPVGHYGNGFKSGSMRLGKDALVFTKDGKTKSVGFLSQTYLEAIKAETVLVPLITWDSEEKIVQKTDGLKALQDILKYSVFKTEDDLKFQFGLIPDGDEKTGTRIIISNTRQTVDGQPEFDFISDPSDIKIPDDIKEEERKYKKQQRQNHIPESDYSLRAYCSILYLKPKMQIMLRGKKVKTVAIAKSLSKTEVDCYKPSALGNKNGVKIVFGFSQNKNHYGIMMYHRNRLIKPYVRVGYQLKANNQGVGVIGVIQCDFLQPTHNKQDFDYTKTFRACMSSLGIKLNEYWNEKKGIQRNAAAPIPEPQEVQALPDQTWVQCDNPHCLKWRKLPEGTEPDKLPEKWYCKDNPDPAFRSCNVPEEKDETEPEETVQPYVKTQKKRLEKELEEKKRKEKESKLLAEKKQKEEAKKLELKKLELQKKEEELNRLKKRMEEQVKTNEAAILKNIEANSRQQLASAQQKSKVKPEPLASPVKLQVRVLPITSSAPKRTVVPVQAPVKQTTPQIAPRIVTVSPSVPLVVSKQNTNTTPPTKFVIINSATNASPQVVRTLPSTAVVKGSQQVVVKQSVASPLPTALSGTTMKMVPVVPQQVAAVAPKVVSAPFGLPTQISQVKPAVTPQIVQVNTQQTNPSAGQKVIHIKIPNQPVQQLNSQPITTAVKNLSNQTAVATRQALLSTPQTPSHSTAVKPSTAVVYKPLESLKEVKRHVESSVSPMSALITEESQSQPSELGRHKVTVNDRYRYIAPSSQGSPTAIASGKVTTAASSTVQNVNVPSSAVVAATEAQNKPSVAVQSATVMKASSVQEKQPAVNSANVQPQIKISQVHSGAASVAAVATNSPLPSAAVTKVKSEPQDELSTRIQGNALKRSPSESSDQPPAQRIKLEPKTTGYKDDDDDDCIIIETPQKPKPPPEVITVNGGPERHEEKEKEKEKEKESIDKSIENLSLVAKFCSLKPQEVFDELIESKSKLRDLRSNVCKLLAVLVPELDLGDTEQKNFLDDSTVDELLKQVLDANTQSEANAIQK